MDNRRKTPRQWTSLSDADKTEFWSSIDSVVADCDGVLWSGDGLIPGSDKVINGLKALGKTIFLFSNNCSTSSEILAQKSQRLGFQVYQENVLLPTSLAVHYLKSLNFKKKVFLIGGEEYESELKNGGFDCIGVGPDYFKPPSDVEHFDDSKFNLPSDPDVGAVVIGHDFHFSYVKLFRACQYLSNPECLFIGSAADVRYPFSSPHSKMKFAPAAGSFLNLIASVSNREPVIIGKPGTIVAEIFFKARGLDPKRTLMIGDSLTTDIRFGNAIGMKTLLVLSGMTKSVDETEGENEEYIPSLYADNLADLLGSI